MRRDKYSDKVTFVESNVVERNSHDWDTDSDHRRANVVPAWP